MPTTYRCLKCGHSFATEFTEVEVLGSLEDVHGAVCAKCTQRVGRGPATCGSCGAEFELFFKHAHRGCKTVSAPCAICGAPYEVSCTCP
jgi:DNA-directed RNA polymerase subunit RPC12/RpoP